MRSEFELLGFEKAFEYSERLRGSGMAEDSILIAKKAFIVGWLQSNKLRLLKKSKSPLPGDAFKKSRGHCTATVSNSTFYSPKEIANKSIKENYEQELSRQPVKNLDVANFKTNGLTDIEERRSRCKILARKYQKHNSFLKSLARQRLPLSDRQIEIGMEAIAREAAARKYFDDEKLDGE